MEKYLIAKDTWVLSQVFPVALATNINANSMIIAGREPVIVDTGPAVTRDEWLRTAWAIVDPAAVRWVFLSHDDGDHIGNLLPVLEACPNAKVVTARKRPRMRRAGAPMARATRMPPTVA